MYHAGKGVLSATSEIMTVHVDLKSRKVVPMAARIRNSAADLFGAHLALPRPDRAGRRIGISRT